MIPKIFSIDLWESSVVSQLARSICQRHVICLLCFATITCNWIGGVTNQKSIDFSGWNSDRALKGSDSRHVWSHWFDQHWYADRGRRMWRRATSHLKKNQVQGRLDVPPISSYVWVSPSRWHTTHDTEQSGWRGEGGLTQSFHRYFVRRRPNLGRS